MTLPETVVSDARGHSTTTGAANVAPGAPTCKITAPGKRLLDVSAASEYLGVAKKTVKNWASAGRISCVRFSRRCTRFDVRDLDRMIESRKVGAILDTHVRVKS